MVAFLSRVVHSLLSQKEYLSRILADISVLGMSLRKVYFTALRSLKKYDPGALCGIEYCIMYCKFARLRKYEFLRFGIFDVQGKKCLYLL